jgi:hypothetical protein
MPLYETLKTILTDYPTAKNEPLAGHPLGAFIRRSSAPCYAAASNCDIPAREGKMVPPSRQPLQISLRSLKKILAIYPNECSPFNTPDCRTAAVISRKCRAETLHSRSLTISLKVVFDTPVNGRNSVGKYDKRLLRQNRTGANSAHRRA